MEIIGAKYLFRLKGNKKEVQYINENSLNDYSFMNKKIYNRIVKYRVENSDEDYYMLTNLNKSIDEIKDLYWKRWQVEIHFKESKYNLSLNTINLKTENSLKQKIYIYNLIFILYYYFKFDVKNPIKYIKILSYQNFMQIYKIKKQIYIFYCIYNKIYFKNNQ
jgi:IS4 transposase